MTETTNSAIDPAKVLLHVNGWRGCLSLSDGIHYAAKGSLTQQQTVELHTEIVHRINVALVDRLVPAGLIRGVLPIFPIQHVPLEERDVMYAHGVNPIVRRGEEPVLWGNRFIFRGIIYEMFGMFRNESPIHPYLMEFLLAPSPTSPNYLSITREIVECREEERTS